MIGRRAWWGLGGLVMAMAGCGPAPAPQAADGPRAEAAAEGPGASGTAGGKCPQNLVVLYTFSKTAPDDYDFPLTRKALKGRTEFSPARFVVTRDMGQRFFAAFVPSWDLAKKLQERIKTDVQGSTPQIVCAEPEVVRDLKLDLKTGEVAK